MCNSFKIWFMKKHLYILAIAALAFALNACGPTYVVQQPAPPQPAPVADPLPPPAPEPQPEASYQSFYDDLSPYGQWINDPRYGYVWLPEVGPDFKPYATNGHWVYTDEGWTWASDYTWGWATFHYGRWFFQDGYGWMWVPGNEYAPAWVTWRNNDEYYGWAPMGPGVSFDMAYAGGYAPPAHYWNFVPHQYVGSPYVRNYYVNESRNVVIVNNTTVINHITVVNNNNTRNVNYGRGPDPVEVGRFTGTTLRPVPVRMSNRPVPGGQVNNGGLAVYRPRISDAPRNNNTNMSVPTRMAPARVSNLNDARPQNTSVYGSRPVNTGYSNRDNDPVNARPVSGYDRGNGNDRGNHYGEQPQGQAQSQTQPQQQATQPQGNRPFWGRPGNSNGQPQGQQGQGQPQGQQGQQGQGQQGQQGQGQQGQGQGQQGQGQQGQQGQGQQQNQQGQGQQAWGQQHQGQQQQGQQSQGQPNGSRSEQQRPVNNTPVTQPANNQPAAQPVNNQPASNNRPVSQPAGNNNKPITQASVNQPVRNFIPPSRPAGQQQLQRMQTQPAQAPAVQSRPVSRPVTPPPASKKEEEVKDSRPVRQQ
jgi:hypothetical protein